MNHNQLANEIAIPPVGLGTWKLEGDEATATVQLAIEIGYRHFDCASIYANEANIGIAFDKALTGGEVNREEIWVTSKLWNDCHLPSLVRPALESTLRDLRLEYLDLYLIHWPVAHVHGVLHPDSTDQLLTPDQAPLAETFIAMERCREAGLCRHIGVSNFGAAKLQQLHDESGLLPAVNQVESHPYLQQQELLAFQQSQGIVMTAYSPLGSRDRPDQMKRADEPMLMDHPTIVKIADNHNVQPAQILVAWHVNRGVTVIPKSSNAQRLRDNLAASRLALDSDEMQQIGDIDSGYRFVDGTYWEFPGSPYTADKIWESPSKR